MKKLLLLLSIIFLTSILTAQTKAAYIRAGNQALEKKDFYSAMDHYREALEFAGAKIAIHYQYAEAARQFYAYELAIDQYKQVLVDKKANEYPLAAYWLAYTYQQTGNYEKAIGLFNNFISNTNNVLFKNKAIAGKEASQWAMEVVSAPHQLEITHLDKKINTPYSEFGALRRGDTLYYSSYRYNPQEDSNNPPRKITKILTQKGTARGRPLARKFNEKNKLTAHNSLTPDGQRIYYTICEYAKGLDIRCDIYYRDMDSRKRWGAAKKLAAPVNLPGTTSTHPAIGHDPLTGKEVLYFVSNRTGGKGGLDIYQIEIKGAQLGELKNLVNINTIEDDITPFYYDSSNTLFFSSEGYRGLGGFDIYQTQMSNTNWKTPTHTGFPLNSSYNDVYFSLNADSTKAYISSNRIGSFFLEKENKACCNDIYEVKILPPLPKKEKVKDSIITVPPIVVIPSTPPTKPEIPITVVDTPAVVIVPPSVIVPPVIEKIIPTEVIPDPPVSTTVTKLESLLPLPLYYHNDEPDPRSWSTTTDKNYEMMYNKYIALRNTYLQEAPQDEETAVHLFFDESVEQGYRQLGVFTEGLISILKAGKKVRIQLSGYTSPRALSDYNLALGKRRTSAVLNYFHQYKYGILKDYIANSQLIFQEISFGEKNAPSSVSDQLNDPKNSVYAPAAARERRVEILNILVK